MEMPFVMGCGATVQVKPGGETVAVPDQARLVKRVRNYYAAIGSRDISAVYQMQLPDIRARMTLEAYKRTFQNWSAELPAKMDAEIDKICSCRSGVLPDGRKAVLSVLLLRVTVDKTGGQQWKGLQVWEYLNGQWYYGFSGGGDECPNSVSGD